MRGGGGGGWGYPFEKLVFWGNSGNSSSFMGLSLLLIFIYLFCVHCLLLFFVFCFFWWFAYEVVNFDLALSGENMFVVML